MNGHGTWRMARAIGVASAALEQRHLGQDEDGDGRQQVAVGAAQEALAAGRHGVHLGLAPGSHSKRAARNAACLHGVGTSLTRADL